MRLIVITFIVLNITFAAKSQTDTTVNYYNSYDHLEKKKKKADYVVSSYALSDGKFYAKKTTLSGQLIETAVYKTAAFLVKDGGYKGYDENGKLRSEGSYSNDIKQKQWHYYDFEGKLSKSCYYVDGRYDGNYERWSNGQKIEQGKFEDNREVGIWQGWHQNGQLASEGRFGEKGRMGLWTYYYPSGKISSKEMHTSDLESTNVYFNEAGDTIEYVGEKEKDPQFLGGQNALAMFVVNNLQYPEVARQNNEQGVVYVRFVIMRDGSVADVNIYKSASPSLDDEALRVIKSMPNWQPGEYMGRTVKVIFTIPVPFRLG